VIVYNAKLALFLDPILQNFGTLDMNKQNLSVLSLLACSLTIFGVVGCKPADTQVSDDKTSAPEPTAEVAQAKPAKEKPALAPTAAKTPPKEQTSKPSTTSNVTRIEGDLPTIQPKVEPPVTDPAKLKKDPKAPQANPANLLPQAIEASPETLDLGSFSTSEKRTGKVTLTNTAEEAVTIISARASCGCTTSDFKNNTVLNPGESTDISITMNGKGKARTLSKTVTFTIDGRPPLRLAVKGETVSFVSLDVDPLVIDEETGSSTVTLTSKDGEPFKVLSILPAIVENFSEEPAPTQELILDWDRFWDEVRTTKVTIRLDHPKCKEITTNVRLSAEQRKRLNDIIKKRRSGEDLPTKDPDRPLTGDQLTRYIKAGRGEQVLKYINDGKGKFDASDRAGVSLLSTAAQEGDAATVLGLLELGAVVNRVDRVNRTPLMYGARSKDPEVITLLVDAGADIQARDSLGNTPLSWAAGFGTGDVVQELVDSGADVNTVDTVLGYTPLLWASGFGEPQSVRILLEAGTDLEVHDTAEGRTPLMHAVRTGKVEGVTLLLAGGANVNALDNTNNTGLHIAAAGNNVSIEKVKALVENGADTSLKNKQGQTPLDLAKARTDQDAKAVVDYLTEHSKQSD
jgi:ankyrin repeat protein